MSLETTFAQFKQAFPSAEWIVLRAPFPPGCTFAEMLPLKHRVNDAEFQGRASESMLFMGPAGSSGRLGRLHFFCRPEGWNMELAPDGQTYRRVVHQDTNREIYDLADFSPLAAMIVPDPCPYWGGSREVTEPLRPGRHVDVQLSSYRWHTNPETLMVLVRNVGDQLVGDLSVRWEYQNERLQPMKLGDIPFDHAGGSNGLNAEEGFDGTLAPGRIEPFVLPAFMMASTVNQAAALSPEQYWLAVYSGQEEIHRVDGRVIGGHLERVSEM